MKTYQQRKEEVRQEANNFWTYQAPQQDYSWEEIADFQDYFRKLGKRYGLLKEFKENGIC